MKEYQEGRKEITMETKDKKLCFVITPIGDNNSDIRRHIDGIIDQAIEPALGGKYEIEVAHRKYEIGSINDRVIKNVFEADLVITNLTNTNPNVMYEMAIRHSFGKPAIIIAEEGTKLPFDVVDENTIFYRNDPTGANELKQKLIEYEKAINLEKKEFGPVYKVVNSIPLYNEVESGKNVSSDKALQYIIDRLDSLEKKINVKVQSGSEKNSKSVYESTLCIEFRKDGLFNESEVDEIVDNIKSYVPGMSYYMYEISDDNIFEVRFIISDPDNINMRKLYGDIQKYIDSLKKKIVFRIYYKNQIYMN